MNRLMIRGDRAYFILVIWSSLLTAAVVAAQDTPPIPQLIVPGENDPALPAGVVRRFGATAFRHGNVASGHFSPGEPFFSPEGDTVYVPGSFSVMAFDPATGRMRFHYRYSQYNVSLWNDAENGVRINFTQGPRVGEYAVIEHGTGKELSRGKQAVLKGTTAYFEFANGTRALATQVERGDRRKNGGRERSTTFLYDVLKEKVLAELGSGGRLHSSVLSPDRRRLAFLSEDMELTVFDTDTGLIARSLPLELKANGDETFPVWSRDGKTVYTWRRNQEAAELVSIDVDSGDIRVLVKDGRFLIRSSPVVSPDGVHLAYLLDDNPWQQNSYWRIVRLADLSEAHIVDVRPARTTAAFSPDGKSFWLLSYSGLARFDLTTGKLDPLTVDTLTSTDALSFSPDGEKLYAVNGGRLITWEVATGREIEPRGEFEEHCRNRSGVRCVYVSPDGRRTIWTGTRGDAEVQGAHVFAVEDGKQVAAFYAANASRHREFDLAADYSQIVHDAYNGELKLCNLWNGKVIHELLPMVRPRQNHVFALAPDNLTMALVHQPDLNANNANDVEIELWDLQSGKKTGGIKQGGSSQMTLQFSQDSRELRIYHRGELSIWDVPNRALIRRRPDRSGSNFLESTPNRHWQICYSFRPGGKQLDLVDVHGGQVARTWDHPEGGIAAIAFSRDQHQMAIASSETSAAIYSFYDSGPDSPDLSKRTLAQLIEGLGGDNAGQAYHALCELIRRGDDAVPALAGALTRQTLPAASVAELIQQLDDPEFEIRDGAMKKLQDMPSDIAPQLREALERGGSQEKLTRLKRILSRVREGDVARDRITTYRAIEALAAIRTPAALKLLEEAAAGPDGEVATHEARATLGQ